MNRFLVCGFFVSISALIAPCFAIATEPTPPPQATVVDDLASAKELFRKGFVHFEARDYGRALPFFESSRALVPSHQNTWNIALCLDGLRRNAEALLAYEHFVRNYGSGLDAATRNMADTRIAELRRETFVKATPPPTPTIAPAVAARVLPVQKKPGRLTTGVFLGYAGGPSLGSDAEVQAMSSCGANCPLAHGGLVGGRFGYRVSSVFSLELSGGYMQLGSSFQRDVADTYGAADEFDVVYRLKQQLLLSGPFGGLGVSARFPITQRFSMVGRLGIAGLSASVSTTMSGDTIATDDPATLIITHDRTMVRTTSVLVTPEVTMEASLGSVVLGAGLGVWVSTTPGPSYGTRTLLPENNEKCLRVAESASPCAQQSEVTSDERSNGAFVVFVPQISARYQFD